MAGLYPDAPGRLFQYDTDGSQAFYINNSGVLVLLTTAEAQTLLNEATDVYVNLGVSTSTYLGVIFPELRDLAGYFVYTSNNGNSTITPQEMATSANTTNGIDGTWTTVLNPWTRDTSITASAWRTVRTQVAAGIKAVRFRGTTTVSTTGGWGAMHLYGSIPAASTPDRLTLWHPTLDQELSGAGLDFGDVMRSTTYDKTFRIKNRSATLTANSILLSMAALTDTSPTYLSQYTISVGGAYAATGTIASVAPGAISAVCTLRLTTTASAGLSTWRQRLSAVATTWS